MEVKQDAHCKGKDSGKIQKVEGKDCEVENASLPAQAGDIKGARK